MLEKRIADKIRKLRKNKGLTLAQLGQEIGLSKGLLSRIENNQVSPPIATLSKISKGLGVPISVFFDGEEGEEERYSVTGKRDRRQVVRMGTRIGFTYFSLTHLKSRHLIEPFIVRYPVITKEPSILFDHTGEEFLFVLKGKMEFVYGKEKVRLNPGDAIHFDPSVSHRGQNTGRQECECLVIVVDKEAM
ncbi:MAG: helix-turn-helix transcriptional regulator [Deltaproteobacteria bacterium]|nr:helix-turn-helix transcriptional regulator [Deltaproteobacteria bacterium]MBW1948221.1 helix-turn-helix transcriptional regulator [Deltaproteobacteria bacterium]MBW2006567.1 helix-turn-helix transcriptional regulator [Deltaproteobacteria bacterium]MBW2346382.1 helix-turn-helix transcriptional regulator [Deltaproteobacteria bacterium]RLB39997.1 MAG: Cro/Cl family transcriptional regulator [Deltaproteobacteria bacterium]